jgi:hypothetical protein
LAEKPKKYMESGDAVLEAIETWENKLIQPGNDPKSYWKSGKNSKMK